MKLKTVVFVLFAMILCSAAAFAEEAGSQPSGLDRWWRVIIVYGFAFLFVSLMTLYLWGDQLKELFHEDLELVDFEIGPDPGNPTLPMLREKAKQGKFRFTYLYHLKPDPDKGFMESGEFQVHVTFSRFRDVEKQSPRIRIDGVEVRFDHIASHCAKIARAERTASHKDADANAKNAAGVTA